MPEIKIAENIHSDIKVSIPERKLQDTFEITFEQIEKIKIQIKSINVFLKNALEIKEEDLFSMGKNQANSLEKELITVKKRVRSLWFKKNVGLKIRQKFKGVSIEYEIAEIDDLEEPTTKQLGYLLHLINENSIKEVPDYLPFIFNKWQVSECITALKKGKKDYEIEQVYKSKKNDKNRYPFLIILLIVMLIILLIGMCS